jgi:acetyl-CoA carboxylase biotin carboxyl carrier protein
MSSKDSASRDPFDLEKLRQLVEMMEKHGLTEVSLRHGEEQWRLRRGGRAEPVLTAVPQAAVPMAAAPAAAAPVASAPATVEPAGVEIKSPTVGTFYASPSPDEPAFLQVGTKVSPDTIVCLIEAMKVFNQIPAEVSGTVTAILVKNGDAVEYGQPLFRVKP